MKKGKFYKVKKSVIPVGSLINEVLDQIGDKKIKVIAIAERNGVQGLAEYEIIHPNGDVDLVTVNESRFEHLWCVLTDYEFDFCFEEVIHKEGNPKPEDGSHDWGVWTSCPGAGNRDTYKGGLTKEEAVAFAKSQRLNATDEVKVVIMQPFAIPVVNVNIRPF